MVCYVSVKSHPKRSAVAKHPLVSTLAGGEAGLGGVSAAIRSMSVIFAVKD